MHLIDFGVSGAESPAEAIPARGVFIWLFSAAPLAPERCAHRLQRRRALGISPPPAQIFSLSLQGLNHPSELCPAVKL